MAFGSLLGFRNAQAAGEISNTNTSIRVTSGTSSWGSRGAETSDFIPANTSGSITFETTLGVTGQNYPMIGFTASGETPSAHYTTIDFCLYASSQVMDLRVYENGAYRGIKSGYTIGDRVGVARNGATGVITYLRNGSVIFTSSLTTTGELKGDFAFYLNSQCKNVIMNRGSGDFNPFYQNKSNVVEFS